ncbi:hypothetical protein T03_1599 [Trichinella britovi]|uniref:Uncharacterized protein n=1 Tax=Trichinella britovi TaxID=45882 RepID=A0A0V1AK33_TRIBR|nr:hypothetical protein T03_1599 [Trichinella britovi]
MTQFIDSNLCCPDVVSYEIVGQWVFVQLLA